MADEDRPIAWSALEKGTPIYGADGEELGKVAHVIADDLKDIFSGITYRPHLFDSERFVPADLIDRLTRAAVRLKVSSEEAEKLVT